MYLFVLLSNADHINTSPKTVQTLSSMQRILDAKIAADIQGPRYHEDYKGMN